MPRLYPNYVYDVINQRYFGNQLPKVPVRFVNDMAEGVMGYYMYPGSKAERGNNPGEIRLSSAFRKWSVIWIGTLIHEMVHVELRDRRIRHHGYVFQRRMKELVNAGAFKDLI